jgi:hypothetical protein
LPTCSCRAWATTLSAQIARADFARDHPLALIDFRWFGGTLPFGYSLWTPFLMAVIGAKITGALAAVGSVAIFSRLLVVAEAPHALLGGMTATVSLAANLIEGRTTFAGGVVFGLAAVLALTRRDGTGRPLAVPAHLDRCRRQPRRRTLPSGCARSR